MAIELWQSQVIPTKKVPAQQFGSETARTIGNAISGVGSALEQAGDQVQQKAELMRRTNVANQFDKARIESNKELMKLKFEADQDQDYENMRTKYANKLSEIKANINGMITEPEAKQRFNNDFDYDAGMTEINIAKSQQDKMIEQKKALYLESMDADMNTFYNTDNPKEKAIIRQRMLSRIDEHQQIGVIRPDVAVQAKISLRKELDEGNVQYDIDRDPAKAIANLDNGLYQNLNKKDRADLKDKALSAIRRNQLINEEQTKQVHQENNRLMTVKALDKQLTRQEIRDALNANQISVSNAENLIKNIESEKAVKASDYLKLWSDLNSKTLNTDYDRNKLEYEILDANNKGLLKDTTAKSLLDKSANFEDKADTRLIKLNNTGLKVWATESGVLEDEKDMLEFNIEKRINEENPQGKDAINSIYQEEKDKLLRKLHPEIAPLEKTPNTIYLDRKFNDVTNITQPSKPNYVYDTEQNKLVPNKAESELYTVYVPKKSTTIGFSQKPDAKTMHDVIQKEFYPVDFNKRQIKKVKQYFNDNEQLTEPSQEGSVLNQQTPRENIIYQTKTSIGQKLVDAGKWAQTAIENAGLKGIQSLTETPIKAFGGISDIGVNVNKERLLKIYELAGQKPPESLANQPENQGAQLANRITETLSQQVGGFEPLNKFGEVNTDLDYGQKLAGQFGSAGGSILAFMGASLLTGGSATAPALIAGLQQTGLKYTQAKEAGKTSGESASIALKSGATEGLLEGLGFNFLLKKYGGALSSIAIRSFTEGTQEVLQTAGEQAIDVTSGLRKNPSMRELIQEQFESFIVGFGIGAPSSIIVTQAERAGFIPELQEMGFTKGQARHIVNKMVTEARTITNDAVIAEIEKIDSGETEPLINESTQTQEPIAQQMPIPTQIWEIPKEEYLAVDRTNTGATKHKQIVEQAIKDGKPVPKEVLAGYNNLVKKYKIDINNQPSIMQDLTEIQPPQQAEPAPVSAKDTQAEPQQNIQEFRAGAYDVELQPEAITNKTVNKTQIINYVEKTFDMPVRSIKPIKGKINKDAKGVYQRYEKLASLQKWGELEPLTHELAHHIDDAEAKIMGDNWYSNINNDITNELKNLDYNKMEQRPSEGFAEFMRYYLTTNKAQEVAPKFYDYFVNDMLVKNPKLNKDVSGLKDMLKTWREQGARNRILAQIDFKGEHRDLPFGVKMQAVRSKVITQFIDELYPVQKISEIIESKIGRKLKPSEDPFKIMTALKGKSNETARSWILDKPVDIDGNVIDGGKSLSEIFAPILDGERINLRNAGESKAIQDFILYATAKRAELYRKQGLESGLDLNDVEQIIQQYQSPVFDKAIDEITTFFDSQLGLLVKYGVLSQSQYETIRQLNPIYIPLKRAFMDTGVSGISSGRIVNTGQGILSRTGGSRPIINPIESMIAQTKSMMDRVAKARIAKTISEMEGLGEGLGEIIREASVPIKATNFNLGEIKSQLKDMDIDVTESDLDAVLTVFDAKKEYNGKENVVSVWQNGQRKFYEINKELYDVLDNFGIEKQKSWIIKKAQQIAHLKRLGATGLNVAFGVIKNPFKDTLTTWVYSKTGVNPIDTAKSFYGTITGKESDLELRMKRAGITMSGFVGQDRKQIAPLIDEMLLQNLGRVGKTLQIAKHPIDALTGLIAFTEIINRKAEFTKSYERLSNEHPDWSEEDVFIESFNRAQDITVNFSRSGQTGKYINGFSAFYNANIQGKDKLYREIKNNPASFIAKGLAYIMPIALSSWYFNKDKEWYKNLPLDFKYNNLFFEFGDTVYRIGLPFDVGSIFGAIPASIADGLYNTDIKTNKQLQSAKDAVFSDMMGFIPSVDALEPLIDIWRNKNYFGSAIEAKAMQELPSEQRFKPNTPELYKSLSKGFNAMGIEYSPIQIEYLANGYTGGMIKNLSPLAKGKVPFVDSLRLNNKSYPSRQIADFFDEYIPLRQKKTAKTLTRDEEVRFEKIKGMYSVFSQINKKIKESVENNVEIEKDRLNKRLVKELNRYGYK